MKGKKQKRHSGFSLVEMLVTIAVIGIIAAIAIPNIGVRSEEDRIENLVCDTVDQALHEDNLSFVALAGVGQTSKDPRDLRRVLNEISLGAWVDISETSPRGNYPERDPKQMVLRHWQLALTDGQIARIVERGNVYVDDGMLLQKERK